MASEWELPEIGITTKTKPREQTNTRFLPPYHVILDNDDHHSFEFVVQVLCKVLGYSVERCFELTLQAHRTGRAVIWTGPKEVAELKCEQVCSFQEIRDNDQVKLGPLGCTIEPAPGG